MKYTIRNIFGLFVLSISIVVVWAMADEGFRGKLYSYIEPQVNEMVTGLPIMADLQETIERKNAEIASQQAEIERLDQENTVLKSNVTTLSSDLEVATLAVQKERNKLNSEFSRLQNALNREVSSREVAIEQVKNKFAVIRVGDKVLFDTGSSQLKERGKEVLATIADTLAKFKGRQIKVEGHSDNKPISSPVIKKRFPTNWELSSARATSAVRYLIEVGGLEPENVVAVGKGEFHPVASNDDANGRAKNRRIEIVLMPAEDNFKVKQVAAR